MSMSQIEFNLISRKTTLIIGEPQCGKTNLLMSLINNSDFSKCVVCSENFAIEGKIYKKFSIDIINNLLKLQEEQMRDMKDILLILDCCLTQDIIKKHIEDFMRFFSTTRHYFITCVIISCYDIIFPPQIRTNFDCVIVNNNSKLLYKQLYQHYGGFIETYEQFKTMLDNKPNLKFHFTAICPYSQKIINVQPKLFDKFNHEITAIYLK